MNLHQSSVLINNTRSRMSSETRGTVTIMWSKQGWELLLSYFSFRRHSWESLVCEPGTASVASCPRHHNSEGFQDARTPWRGRQPKCQEKKHTNKEKKKKKEKQDITLLLFWRLLFLNFSLYCSGIPSYLFINPHLLPFWAVATV